MISLVLYFLIFNLIATVVQLLRFSIGVSKIPNLKDIELNNISFSKISLVITAKDEEDTLPKALETIRLITYPKLEIIYVNDRSKDKTSEILNDAVLIDSRIKVLNIISLPDGWLGKNHACWLGAEAASGDWLLFTDADVEFHQEALAQAINLINIKQLDHLVVLPQVYQENLIEKAFLGFFTLLLLLRGHVYESRRGKISEFGVGAFNMVRSDKYHTFGGHSAFPLSIDDDMKLGLWMSKCDAIRGLAFGQNRVGLKWQHGLKGLICGLEKNSFAVMNFNWLTLIGITFLLSGWILSPYIFVFINSNNIRLLSIICIILQWAFYWNFRKQKGYHPLLCFIHPISTLLLLYTFWRSAFIITEQSGVRWRDTFYSINSLKHKQKGRQI